MELHFNAYATLVLLSATISFSLGIVAWRNRHTRLANALFALLMFSVGFWALTNFLEHIAPTFSTKLFFSNFVYIGIVCTVATWIVFSLVYTGRSHLLTRQNLLLLSLEPVLLLLLLWTDSWHHLIRTDIWLDSNGSFPILVVAYGPVFWIHTVYSYVLLFMGTLMLLQYTAQAPEVYRKQAIVLVLSMLVPWILNALYLMGITRYGLTAAGFTIAGIGIAWGLLRLRFLDVVPTARTAVFASLHDAVITLDDKNRIVDLNPAAEGLIGCSQSEAIGKNIEDMFAAQTDMVAEYGHMSEVHTELVFTHNDPPVYYNLRISPVYNRRQNLVARVVVLRDITARKMAEQAERGERQLAEALRDVAVALNSTLDSREIFSRILANVERVLPHDSANIMLNEGGTAFIVDVRGKHNEELNEAVWQRRFVVAEVATLQEMVATHQPVVLSDTASIPSWRDYPDLGWIRSYIGVPILQDDDVIGFINLDSRTPGAFQPKHAKPLQAFADQVSVALKNAHLYKALADRNQELDAYAYTIAHDLNAPLALIQGYVGLLAGLENLPEAGRDYLEKISATSGRMTEMIDQLLLLAKLRDVETMAVSINLYPLILAVKMRFEEQIRQRHIHVEIQEDWLPVLGQPVLIEEVLANLLGNAIKYIGRENKAPKIVVWGKRQGEQVCVYVADNGLGINADKQAELFEMFTRYHREEAAGTGLGLAIVQRIVHKLGGEVGVVSDEAQGSTFWFTLPMA